MPNDQIFVGSVTIVLSIASFFAALGNSQAPYNMSLAARIEKRFGKPAARSFYAILGIVLAVLATMILSGFRPSFATP